MTGCCGVEGANLVPWGVYHWDGHQWLLILTVGVEVSTLLAGLAEVCDVLAYSKPIEMLLYMVSGFLGTKMTGTSMSYLYVVSVIGGLQS